MSDDRHTDRQTDASDFITCPMLCYSNGTDNKRTCPPSADMMCGRLHMLITRQLHCD